MSSLIDKYSRVLDFFVPKTYLDIGTNNGETIKGIMKVLPSLSYIEMIEACEYHEPNLKKISEELNIPYHIKVLSDSIKTVNFYIDERWSFTNGSGNSYYKEDSHFFNRCKTEEKITTTLDDLYSETSTFDLIKIDTQGSELDILKGGKNLLSKTKGVIIEENICPYNEGAPLSFEIKSYLESNGFVFVEYLDEKKFNIMDSKFKQKNHHEVDSLYINTNLVSLKNPIGDNFMADKKLAVFYHLFIPEPMESWVWWVEEQMGLLQSTGLADNAEVFLCTTLPLGMVNQKNNKTFDQMVIEYIKDHFAFVNVLDVRGRHEEPNLFEGQTIKKLWDYCQTFDGYVFYFHSKGMGSYGTHIPGGLNDWKNLMHYFNIEKWKDCVAKLDEGYDACGINLLKEENLNQDTFTEEQKFLCNHFAGNFWWATAKHIRNLPDPLDMDKYSDVKYMMEHLKTYRYAFEVWMGHGCKSDHSNYYSFHQSNVHHYFELYPKKRYINLPSMEEQAKDPVHIITLVGAKNQFNWKSHITFAQWIVRRKNPEVVVDLGVDYAYSTFCFGLPKIGKIYGIDSFEGDDHAGLRDTYKYVNEKKEELGFDHITFIKGYFDDVAKTWDKPIDILHIDGFHTYEAVKNDYDTWNKFVKEDGVILFHDTCVNNPGFGVRKFFGEIDLPKVNFHISNGLGVVSKDQELIEEIKTEFAKVLE